MRNQGTNSTHKYKYLTTFNNKKITKKIYVQVRGNIENTRSIFPSATNANFKLGIPLIILKTQNKSDVFVYQNKFIMPPQCNENVYNNQMFGWPLWFKHILKKN